MKKTEIFNVNAIYFIVILCFSVVRLLSAAGVFSALGESAFYVTNILIEVVLMFLLPLVLYSVIKKQRYKTTFQNFGFKKINWKSVLICVLIGVIVFFLNLCISSFFNFIITALGYNPSTTSTTVDATWGNFALQMLFVAILPAFCEEFTHRGMLIKGYSNLGFKRAVIYSAILFGLMHLNIEQFFYASIVGALLGCVTLLTQSIVPAMIIHFLNNGINVYLEFAAAKNLPFGNLFDKISAFLTGESFIFALFIIILAIGLMAALLVFLVMQLFKINAKKTIQTYSNIIMLEKLREEVLDGVQVDVQDQPQSLTTENLQSASKELDLKPIDVQILGFSMRPTAKATALDNMFFWGSILLGSIITVFSFVWGVL